MIYVCNPTENNFTSANGTTEVLALNFDAPVAPPAADAPNPAVLKLLNRHLKEHRPLWQALANS